MESYFPRQLPLPPAKYRPFIFWNWNNLLTEEELRRQFPAFIEGAYGGFCMHARAGLKNEYLSDDWMRMIETGLELARDSGLDAWIWDENGWPAGFAGGLVNGAGVDFQQKYLRYESVDSSGAQANENTIGFYSEDGCTYFGSRPPAGYRGRLLHCFRKINRYYVDNLNPAAVARFVEVTYTAYARKLKPELLPYLKGFFTDEPQLSRDGLLWSDLLPQLYRDAYNRDLLPELPGVFLNNFPEAAAIRVRFWSLVGRQFRKSYIDQLRAACDRHGWLLTGHHAQEDTIGIQIPTNGDIAIQYAGYHIPGVDQLTGHDPIPVTLRQAAGAAAQNGQEQLMCETFGVGGWSLNFTEMKRLLAFEFLDGVNLFCNHMGFYSLEGLRKREYPPSVFFQQPWWRDMSLLNGWAARLSELLTRGKPVGEVAVLQNLTSGWCLYTGDDYAADIEAYSGSMRRLLAACSRRRLDAEIVDELMLEELGRVEPGWLVVGRRRYRKLILPKVCNLLGSTVELLRAFAAAGGEVLRLPVAELLVDGMAADAELRNWLNALPEYADEEALAAAAARNQPLVRVRDVDSSEPDCAEVGALERKLDGGNGWNGRFFFLVNRNQKVSHRCEITLPHPGRVLRIDPADGRVSELPAEPAGDEVRIQWEFPPVGDLAVVVQEGVPAAGPLPAWRTRRTLRRLAPGWKITESDVNVLTLDKAEFRVAGSDWQKSDLIAITPELVSGKYCGKLELRFSIRCDDDFPFDEPVELLWERPACCSWRWNGKDFTPEITGWLFDRAFRRFRLPGGCVPGENELRVTMEFYESAAFYAALERARHFESEYNLLQYDTEVEAGYLIGSFGVRHSGEPEFIEPEENPTASRRYRIRLPERFTLGAAPRRVNLEHPVLDGLPFFAGCATFAQELELTKEESRAEFLEFDARSLFGVEVKVNGTTAGIAGWPPYRVRIAGLLREGDNRIELKVATSLRNMLGPFHLADADDNIVGTMHFNTTPNALGWPPPANVPAYAFADWGIENIRLTES